MSEDIKSSESPTIQAFDLLPDTPEKGALNQLYFKGEIGYLTYLAKVITMLETHKKETK